MNSLYNLLGLESGGFEDERFCNHEIRYMKTDAPKMRKVTEQPLVDPALEDHGEDAYYNILDEGCIYCGGEFLEGPGGGLCQNVKCADCGQKYNIMPVGEDGPLAQLI